jgi:hypothetical protein
LKKSVPLLRASAKELTVTAATLAKIAPRMLPMATPLIAMEAPQTVQAPLPMGGMLVRDRSEWHLQAAVVAEAEDSSILLP